MGEWKKGLSAIDKKVYWKSMKRYINNQSNSFHISKLILLRDFLPKLHWIWSIDLMIKHDIDHRSTKIHQISPNYEIFHPLFSISDQ
jgi:hypothetical protein